MKRYIELLEPFNLTNKSLEGQTCPANDRTCKGKLKLVSLPSHDEEVAFDFMYRFKDVPIYVCQECGEVIWPGETIGHMEEQIKKFTEAALYYSAS